MRVRRMACAMLLVFAFATLGCGGNAPSPVGTLTVQPQRLTLGYPGAATISLDWAPERPLGEVAGTLKVMVHLQNGAGDLVRTFDHQLPADWQPGDPQIYDIQLYQSLLGPPLQPGEYVLGVGLYDLERRRWPLMVIGGEDLGRHEYKAVVIEVPEQWAGVPSFSFDENWSGVEGGADLQILGRRSMQREAALAVSGIEVPGSVWLRLRVPELRPGVESLSLDEGEDEPTLTITGSCGEFGAVSSGSGSHRVELPIGLLVDGTVPDNCDFALTANFTIVEEASGRRTSAYLEGLSWSPASD